MNKRGIYRQALWVVCVLVFFFSWQKSGIYAERKEVKQLHEIPEMRHEYTKGFRNSDGSVTMRVSSKPLNFLNSQGQWEQINTTTEEAAGESDADGEPYLAKVVRNSFKSYFPRRAKGWVTIRTENGHLEFKLNSKAPQTPFVKGLKGVRAVNYLENCDLDFQVENGVLKEKVVVKKRGGAPRSFDYLLRLHNLTAVNSEDGGYSFVDPAGKKQLGMTRFFMYDSAGAISKDLTVTLEKHGAGYLLRVTPNQAWLAAPERVYPVTVDPTIFTIKGDAEYNTGNSDRLFFYIPCGTTDASYNRILNNQNRDIPINTPDKIIPKPFPIQVKFRVWAGGGSGPGSDPNSAWHTGFTAPFFRATEWEPGKLTPATRTSSRGTKLAEYIFPKSNIPGSQPGSFMIKDGKGALIELDSGQWDWAGVYYWGADVGVDLTYQVESMSPEPPVLTQLAPETYERAVTLRWTAPSDNVNIDPATGEPYPNVENTGIKEYVVQHSTSSDFTKNKTEVRVAAPATQYTFTGLTNGTTYYFRCYAVDGDGNPTDMDDPWDPVNFPFAIRWSAVTKTKCVAATLKPTDPNKPAITEIMGANVYGSGYLGNNRNPNVSFTIPDLIAQPFIKVAAGGNHSLALNADGTVYSWGANTDGQLGDGTTTDQVYPVRVKTDNGQPLTNITAIACGKNHSLALKSDGTVWAWGDNSTGQLGNGKPSPQSSLPVQVMLNATTPLTGVSAVSCGSLSSYALKNDGTVWGWGENSNRELGDGSTSPTDQKYAVQMKVNSTPITNVIAIAAGVSHILVLKNNGTVWASGLNDKGQLGNNSVSPSTTVVQVKDSAGTGFLTGITAIAAGTHSLALANNGTVWAWGENASGQLGNGNTTFKQKPVHPTSINNVTAIAAGVGHSLAQKSDGSLWAWGDNTSGQLGYHATNTQMTTPVLVKGLMGIGNMENVSAFDGGNTHTMAVKNDGSVWLWGDGANGMLGNGSTVKQSYPINTICPLQTQGQIRATRYLVSPGTALDYPAIPFDLGSNSVDTNWNLPDGKYLFYVGIPATGGGYAWSPAKLLTIDTVLPEPFTIEMDSPDWTNYQWPVLTFNTTDNVSGIDHYELTVDNEDAQTVTSPYTLPEALTDGIHNLNVTAVDRAGNRREATAKAYIDTTPPKELEVTANPSGWTNNPQPVITFSAKDSNSGVDHYEMTIDGGDAQVVTSPFTLPVLTDGTHTIKVTAFDKVGLSQEAVTTVSVDGAKPEAGITSPASEATVTGSVMIVAAAADTLSGVASVEFYIDEVYKGTVSQAPYQFQFESDIYLNGDHDIKVIVSDLAGNKREASIEFKTQNDTISVSGVLETDQEWDKAYYNLTGNVTVPLGKTLTIKAGAKVTSGAGYALIIAGTLIVQGATDNPVIFQTSGAIWQGIQIKPGGNAEITNAIISGARRGLAVTGGSATVTGCIFQNNQTGLHVYGGASIVTVGDTIFNHNSYYGIKEDDGARPQIVNCGFTGNGIDYYSAADTELTMDELNGINNNSGNHI